MDRHTACCLAEPDRAFDARLLGIDRRNMRAPTVARRASWAWQADGAGGSMQKSARYSGPYTLVFAAVTVIVGLTAIVRRDGMITMAAAVLGLYILHLLSLQALTRSGSPTSSAMAAGPGEGVKGAARGWERRPATDDSAWMVQLSDPEEEPEFLPVDSDRTRPDGAGQKGVSEVPIPRKFALGTVAIIRRALDPAQVARVLEEQRKFPKKRFGEIAIELDYINENQLNELLAVQQAGLFTEEEIQSARTRLEAFRRQASSPATP